MKIWYISKYATPLKYGFGSRHFYIAREFVKLGHDVTLISSDSNHLANIPKFRRVYAKEIIDGIETWWIKTIRYKRSNSIKRVLSWIDFETKFLIMPKARIVRPDVVIVSSLSLLTILNGYWLKRRFGCKLVFEIRDIWPLTITEEGGFNQWNPLVMVLSWVERFGYNKADITVGTMPNLAEHVREIVGRKTNCHCVPFGYDPVLYKSPEPLSKEYEEKYIPKNKFIIGYAGSIGITNALDTLMQCALEMKDDPEIHFLILGDGGLLNHYRTKTAGLPNITFAPKVNKAQVGSVLAHCQVLYLSVFNSRVWKYGLSLNKLIDYMMAGKPIIASYNGYPSMINEAQCGIFVPAEDVSALRQAIYRYKETPSDGLTSMGMRGREWLLKNRTYDKIAIEYNRLVCDDSSPSLN